MLKEIREGVIARRNVTGGLAWSYITGELWKENPRDALQGEYRSQQTKFLPEGKESDEVTLKGPLDRTCDLQGRPPR